MFRFKHLKEINMSYTTHLKGSMIYSWNHHIIFLFMVFIQMYINMMVLEIQKIYQC